MCIITTIQQECTSSKTTLISKSVLQHLTERNLGNFSNVKSFDQHSTKRYQHSYLNYKSQRHAVRHGTLPMKTTPMHETFMPRKNAKDLPRRELRSIHFNYDVSQSSRNPEICSRPSAARETQFSSVDDSVARRGIFRPRGAPLPVEGFRHAVPGNGIATPSPTNPGLIYGVVIAHYNTGCVM